MFKSESPIFMPISYMFSIFFQWPRLKPSLLRLDSNILFYKKNKAGGFNLYDIFTVEYSPIMLDLGTWDKSHGLQLEMSIYRWDRRTDMKWARCIINVASVVKISHLVDSIGGERSVMRDSRIKKARKQLDYIAKRLNLEIRYGFGTGHGRLVFLPLPNSDGNGFASKDSKDSIMIASKYNSRSYTFLAGHSTEKVAEHWDFFVGFGLPQWMTFFSALIVISLVMNLCHRLLDENDQRPPISQAFVTTFLFVLQQGNHPESRHISKRILSLTLSMLTMVFMIYYSNDITSKMTTGPPPHPVRSFQDVLEKKYKVIIVGAETKAYELLKDSKDGTTMQSVFKLNFGEYSKNISDYKNWIRTLWWMKGGKEPPSVPSWYNVSRENYELAKQQIIAEEKTLWFTDIDSSELTDIGFGIPALIQEGKVVALEMDDPLEFKSGILFKSFSEYRPLFAHHIMRGEESGMFDKFHKDHLYRQTSSLEEHYYKIELDEDAPLGITNIVSAFYMLGAFSILSFIILIVELLVHRMKSRNNEVQLMYHNFSFSRLK